jgi:hypothetical protein
MCGYINIIIRTTNAPEYETINKHDYTRLKKENRLTKAEADSTMTNDITDDVLMYIFEISEYFNINMTTLMKLSNTSVYF